MKVELIPVKGRKKTVHLIVEGETIRELSCAIFGYHLQIPDKITTQEELEQHLEALEKKGASYFALKRLALRSYPREKLSRKLIDEGVRASIVAETLGELEKQGYLNDQEWALGVAAGLKRRKMGPERIRMKLKESKIAEELIRGILAEGDVVEEIRSLLLSRYKGKDLSKPKERDKVIRSLLRRGYHLNDIFGLIKT